MNAPETLEYRGQPAPYGHGRGNCLDAVTVVHVKRAASRQSHRAQIAFHEAMLYFYRKHYAATTPAWLGWLVVLGIQINLNWTRLRERLTRRAAPAPA